MKASNILLTIATALALSACQGQNIFKRQSDPLGSKYGSLKTENVPAVPGKIQPAVLDPDNSQVVCVEPFKVSVENDQGEKLMTFVEDTKGEYVINVRSFLGKDFNVTLDGTRADGTRADGVSFKQIGHVDNTSSYTLSWKPAKGTKTSTTIVLRYTNAFAQNHCGQDISQRLNLLVAKNSTQPQISIGSGWPQTTVAYGTTFKFTVNVFDPASDPSTPPALALPEFSDSLKNQDHVVLNGATAVGDSCAAGTSTGDGKWEYQCSFSSQGIASVEKQINSGKTIESALIFSATSQRSGVTSPSIKASVRVEFPKIAATTTKGEVQ